MFAGAGARGGGMLQLVPPPPPCAAPARAGGRWKAVWLKGNGRLLLLPLHCSRSVAEPGWLLVGRLARLSSERLLRTRLPAERAALPALPLPSMVARSGGSPE